MHLRKTHIATLVVGLALIFGVAYTATVKPSSNSSQQVAADAPVGTARLTFEPASAPLKVGEEATFKILLDTDGDSTTGVDLALKYNPSLIEVVDANPDVAGTQIGKGELFSLVPLNSVVLATGTINYSAVQQAADEPIVAANQTVAVVTIRAKSAGTANLQFNFTPGASSDTNVAAIGGRDLLNRVDKATLTISQ